MAGRTGGVLVRTTRQGSAGDRGAPTVVDPLITHVDAGRERGRILLSEGGRARLITLSMPLVVPSPGLLLPGMLVEVQQHGGHWRGLVRATSLTATAASVTQAVEIERR